jgi:hypothetical protein
MLDMFVELLLLNLGAFAVGVGISAAIWGRRGRREG